MTVEEKQKLSNQITQLSTTSSEFELMEDFNHFLNKIFSSFSPLTNSSETEPSNLELLDEEATVHSFSPLSQPAISKTILIVHLPLAVNNQWLRTLFPGCRKILFKKNYWNRNFRLYET